MYVKRNIKSWIESGSFTLPCMRRSRSFCIRSSALANIRAAAFIMSIGIRVRPPHTGGSDWLLAATFADCSAAFSSASAVLQSVMKLASPAAWPSTRDLMVEAHLGVGSWARGRKVHVTEQAHAHTNMREGGLSLCPRPFFRAPREGACERPQTC